MGCGRLMLKQKIELFLSYIVYLVDVIFRHRNILFFAIDYDCDELIDKYLSVDKYRNATYNGMDILFYSVLYDKFELAKKLIIDYKMDVNKEYNVNIIKTINKWDRWLNELLYCNNDNTLISELITHKIRQGSDINFYGVSTDKKIEFLDFIIDTGAKIPDNIFTMLALSNNIGLINHVMSKYKDEISDKIDYVYFPKKKYNCIHVAAERDNAGFLVALYNNFGKVSQFGQLDINNRTPLMLAHYFSNNCSVECLKAIDASILGEADR